MSGHRAQRRRRHQVERGMTLVEIMIALAIISMVVGAAAFTGFSQLRKAQIKETKIMMRQVESAVAQYQAETNENCPPTLAELAQRKIMNKEPKDGWSRPFIFKCPGEHNNDIDLVSKGVDGKEGTDDDIRSWEDTDAKDKKP